MSEIRENTQGALINIPDLSKDVTETVIQTLEALRKQD